MKGTRADVRLTELGLAESREKARSMIMEGLVYLQEVRIDKPGQAVPPETVLLVRGDMNPFVSRGGLKLQKAMEKYGLTLDGAVALDIGASTGGFTDCMLQHGAKQVYAIDVGYGQLDWKLRNDPRVVVMERTNARNLSPDWFDEAPRFASIDVSFISVRLILPALYTCLGDGAYAVVLVKPQFEAGREHVGKNGVVRDVRVHAQVLASAADFARATGFAVRHMDYSPIKGPKGNIEFLLVLQKGGDAENCADSPQTVTELAHEALDKAE
ncbi:MAG: TlyA family RNA methyltransferase [Clostridia bacterium]|nr:TlyA family RNA methyltransferase [Clostridia bacterium]